MVTQASRLCVRVAKKLPQRLLMNPPTPSGLLPPKPASHRWVIGLFGFMVFGFCMILLRSLFGRSLDDFLKLPVLLMAMIGTFVALFSMCLGGRRRWVYYLNAAMLIYFAARSIQTAWVFGSHWLSAQPGRTTLSLGEMLSYVAVGVLLNLIAWRFVLGCPSRRYFGLGGDAKPVVENAD